MVYIIYIHYIIYSWENNGKSFMNGAFSCLPMLPRLIIPDGMPPFQQEMITAWAY